jgi:hypothetical protein
MTTAPMLVTRQIPHQSIGVLTEGKRRSPVEIWCYVQDGKVIPIEPYVLRTKRGDHGYGQALEALSK